MIIEKNDHLDDSMIHREILNNAQDQDERAKSDT